MVASSSGGGDAITGRATPDLENSQGCMLISWISALVLLLPLLIVVIDVSGGVEGVGQEVGDTGVVVVAATSVERSCCCCCTLVDASVASRGCVHSEPGARWRSEGGATVDGLSVRFGHVTSFLARTAPASRIAEGLEKLTVASCGRGTTKAGAETDDTAAAVAATAVAATAVTGEVSFLGETLHVTDGEASRTAAFL